ncbi:MAG: DUF22 domain-containing protein [Candidatus Undinarchaeales archaeon]|jgi:hypothetical protein|nr:DUF22 domain-containing protein [Candidatus Undinarchaeales archaeon]
MTTIDKFWQDFKSKRQAVGIKQDHGKVEHLIADEDHIIKKGICQSIKVKNIHIPANHMVFTSLYRMNKNGNVSGVSETEPKPLDMDRKIEYARFTSIIDGNVSKGDFLGFVVLLPLERTILNE